MKFYVEEEYKINNTKFYFDSPTGKLSMLNICKKPSPQRDFFKLVMNDDNNRKQSILLYKRSIFNIVITRVSNKKIIFRINDELSVSIDEIDSNIKVLAKILGTTASAIKLLMETLRVNY